MMRFQTRWDPFADLSRDPFAEMRRIQADMNRLFGDVEGRALPRAFPPVNIWAGENDFVVTAELAGVRAEDLELTVREDTLTLNGSRESQVEGEVAWHRRERLHGRFARTIQLPFRANPDKVEARFINGVLQVRLQRPEEDRPRKIAINAS
jgi:HSP20 family protein